MARQHNIAHVVTGHSPLHIQACSIYQLNSWAWDLKLPTKFLRPAYESLLVCNFAGSNWPFVPSCWCSCCCCCSYNYDFLVWPAGARAFHSPCASLLSPWTTSRSCECSLVRIPLSESSSMQLKYIARFQGWSFILKPPIAVVTTLLRVCVLQLYG